MRQHRLFASPRVSSHLVASYVKESLSHHTTIYSTYGNRGIWDEAQLLTYMKLAGVKTGLLINFNVTKLKNGIKRFVL